MAMTTGCEIVETFAWHLGWSQSRHLSKNHAEYKQWCNDCLNYEPERDYDLITFRDECDLIMFKMAWMLDVPDDVFTNWSWFQFPAGSELTNFEVRTIDESEYALPLEVVAGFKYRNRPAKPKAPRQYPLPGHKGFKQATAQQKNQHYRAGWRY
jgi:hypothetical protein